MNTAEYALRRFVQHSNRIENILAVPGEVLYDGHYEAALLAVNGAFVHPNKLHELLCRDVPSMSHFAGQYRNSGVEFVGNKILPKWEFVPELMEDWLELVRQFLETNTDPDRGSHFLHAWFLCVHPYEDGNGRVSRLIWNNLRTCKGLPLHIEPIENRLEYYNEIASAEKYVFMSRYSDQDIYPNVQE